MTGEGSSPGGMTRRSSALASPKSSSRATTGGRSEPRLALPNRPPPKETQMAHAGQTIQNPVSGERITFTKTAADTNGELLELDIELAPDGAVPGMHVHPAQEER